jgi:hypothetical protein
MHSLSQSDDEWENVDCSFVIAAQALAAVAFLDDVMSIVTGWLVFEMRWHGGRPSGFPYDWQTNLSSANMMDRL